MKKLLRNCKLALWLSVLLLVPTASVFADVTWGPERQTFTWESPAPFRTFNSVTNNPEIGDERNFVRVKEYGKSGPHLDSANIEVGKTYEVYVYYHNDASEHLNETGAGIANNVRLKMEMPTALKPGEAAAIKGTISSTNTTPAEVWDKAYLVAQDVVYLRYVPDSATIYNIGTASGSKLDSRALFDEGAKLIHNQNLWGMIPACNQYAGYVTFRVRADQPKFYITKEVSTDGGSSWSENVTAAPGATLDFKIVYKNVGTTAQTSVKVRDTLEMADGMTYVEGSTMVKIPANPGPVKVVDKLFTDGLVIGNFAPGEEAVITYQVRLDESEEVFGCGATIIYNGASVATANGTMYDKVKITVNRVCEAPKELPKTGPAEIVLAVVIVLGIGAGGVYYWQTRQMVKMIVDDSLGLPKNDKM